MKVKLQVLIKIFFISYCPHLRTYKSVRTGRLIVGGANYRISRKARNVVSHILVIDDSRSTCTRANRRLFMQKGSAKLDYAYTVKHNTFALIGEFSEIATCSKSCIQARGVNSFVTVTND